MGESHCFIQMQKHLEMRQRAAQRSDLRGDLAIYAKRSIRRRRSEKVAFFDIDTPVDEQMDWAIIQALDGLNVEMSWDVHNAENKIGRLGFVIETDQPRISPIPPSIIVENSPGWWAATFILDTAMGDEESLRLGIRLAELSGMWAFGTLSGICGAPNWDHGMVGETYRPWIVRGLWCNDGLTSADVLRPL